MPKPHVQILVCVNERPPGASKPCCGPRDALSIYRRFKDVVRSRGLRDRVMVVRTGCLKHCAQGVTVCLWPSNTWYAGVTIDRVEEIVDTTIIGRGVVAELEMPDVPWQ